MSEHERALKSIAANKCCDKCQDAALVAHAALKAPSPIAHGFNAVRVESGGWTVGPPYKPGDFSYAGAAFTNTEDFLSWLQKQLLPSEDKLS